MQFSESDKKEKKQVMIEIREGSNFNNREDTRNINFLIK